MADITLTNVAPKDTADTHYANTSNPHSVTKTQVGLSNVDNTSDVNKPVSTAQATAIALKVDKVTGSRLITSSESTLLGNTSGINTGDQDLSGLMVKSNNLSDLTNTTTARTNLGLGSLATQSGTFSGTSSGTNTGDQDLSSYQTTTNKDASGGYAGLTLFKINFKNVLNTFTSYFTNSNTASRTYTFPDKDGTVAMTSDLAGGGIWGIANTSGVYTYYSTLTLAMAGATAGKTIEMFADVTETSATNIELKNGVNIQGNGHTYTYSVNDTSYALNQTGSGAYEIKIQNITILRTTGTGGCLNISYLSSGNMHFDGTLFKSTGGGYCFYVASDMNFYNLTCISTTSAAAINYWATGNKGYFINCSGINTSSGNGFSLATGGFLQNCFGKSNSGIGISGGYLSNCTARSNSGRGIYNPVYAYNCVGSSVSNCGIDSTGSTRIELCTGISTSFYGIFVGGTYISKSVGISSSSYGMRSGTGSTQVYDCDGYSSSSVGGYMIFTGKLIGGKFQSDWNNASGNALEIGGLTLISNVTLMCTNASAYCIYSSTPVTLKYSDNTFIGATTAVNSNITQGMTNSIDTYGNILI